MIRHSSLFIASCLILSACGSVNLWYKAGASQAKIDQDLVNCRVRAVQSVPVNTQIAVTPTYVTPVETDCYTRDNKMQCITTGGEVRGGDTYTYDANKGLRKDVVTQCMQKHGYQSISLPSCNSAQAKLAKTYKLLPEITTNTCVTKAPTGWLLVNPE
jgi:hypothetical protein